MSVRLGDIIQQIGSGIYKLVNAKDIDIVNATDGTDEGAMDGTDLLICDTEADGSVKKITISQIDHDTLTNTHDLTTDIDHNAITNYSANKHIDHTAVTLTAGVGLSGGGDISANRTFTVDLNELTTETTIAADDFLAMVDVTDNGSGKITFANLESTLNHDSLAGFVANEHINHTSVTLTAGTGLTGGGDISANRSFALSWLGIESLADPNANNLLGWDDTDGAVKFLTIGANLSYDHATHTLSAAGGADSEKVKVDAAATADYIGAASNDGVLRTTTGSSYADGGNYVTLGLSHLGIESLADPNDNQLVGWDDTDGAMKFIDLGTGLSYDHATHTLSVVGGGGVASYTELSALDGTTDVTGAELEELTDGSETDLHSHAGGGGGVSKMSLEVLC